MTARFVRTFYLLWTPAGIVLVSDDPRGVVGAIELSRTSHRKMIQNLVWGAATRSCMSSIAPTRRASDAD